MRTIGALLLLAIAAQAQDFGPSTAEIDDYVYEDATRKFVPVEAQEEAAPSSWSYEVRAGFWIPDIDGPIVVSGQGGLDLEEVFGLDDLEVGPTLTIAAIKNGKFLIDLDMYWVQYDGLQTVQQTFMLGGNTYEVDQSLITELKIFQAKLHIGWCVYNPNDAVNIGVYVALTFLDLSGDVESVDNTSGTVETAPFDFTVPIPTIGAALWGDIGKGWTRSESNAAVACCPR